MKNNKYKCSIFCSFFKGEQFIKGYTENLLEQTCFSDVEFIFLDCNSPENEKHYLDHLCNKFDNIKYYKLEKDPGLYAAWNHAIKLCSADIIGNWNIDDRKNKEGLEILINNMEKSNTDVLYGITYISYLANERYVDNSFERIYPCFPHTFQNLFNNNSPHCMPLWRKNLHDKFGFFDENYKTASDGDFWLRCAAGGATIKMINHPVGLYYENPKGRSTNQDTLSEMVNEVNQMRSNYQKYLGVIK